MRAFVGTTRGPGGGGGGGIQEGPTVVESRAVRGGSFPIRYGMVKALACGEGEASKSGRSIVAVGVGSGGRAKPSSSVRVGERLLLPALLATVSGLEGGGGGRRLRGS